MRLHLLTKFFSRRSAGIDQHDQAQMLGLKGCIRTLLVIEKGTFPDATCQQCGNLKKCLKLEPEVQRDLAVGK